MLSSLIDIILDMFDSKSNGDWVKGICWEFVLEEAMVDGSDTMKELEAILMIIKIVNFLMIC